MFSISEDKRPVDYTIQFPSFCKCWVIHLSYPTPNYLPLTCADSWVFYSELGKQQEQRNFTAQGWMLLIAALHNLAREEKDASIGWGEYQFTWSSPLFEVSRVQLVPKSEHRDRPRNPVSGESEQSVLAYRLNVRTSSVRNSLKTLAMNSRWMLQMKRTNLTMMKV